MFFVRNLGQPLILLACGLLLMLGVVFLAQQGNALAPLARQLFPWMVVLPLGSVAWALHRLLQVWRWRRGERVGDCRECHGPVSGGRCRMCGAPVN